jgi:hypothetical protein
MTTILEEKLDRPLLFPGLTWEQFKTLEPMLDIPGVRLSFLDRCSRFKECLEENTK